MIKQAPQSRIKRIAGKAVKAGRGFLYFWSGLITSGDNQASMGKGVTWVIVMAYLYWIKEGHIDKSTLVEAFKTVLLYALVGKAMFTASDAFKAMRVEKHNAAVESGDE